MAKRPTIDPALRELKQELLRTNDALKDAYTRFNCVCDSELIEASIYEISALKSRCNYLLRRIKERREGMTAWLEDEPLRAAIREGRR